MDLMKNYKQFIKESPSKKTIVYSFMRVNPPTRGHELVISLVKKIANQHNADYVIYASRTQDKKKNPLSVDKKIHYLNLMFPNTNFKAANDKERTFIEVAKALNEKYKNIIMVAGSDRMSEYTRLLNTYNGKEFNYDSIQVISAGERDPDADDVSGMSASKMRALASDGDYQGFKKGLPTTLRDIDGKLLMNDVRHGMGLEPIKEQFKINVDLLRDQYISKEIFNVGSIVESNGELYQILERGTNHLILVDRSGALRRKWLQDVTMTEREELFTDDQFESTNDVPSEITFKGYTTKNLHKAPGANIAFSKTIKNVGNVDPLSVLNALKSTDDYLSVSPDDIHKHGTITQTELLKWSSDHIKAKRALDRCGEFINHTEYWHMYKNSLDPAVSAVKITKCDSITEDKVMFKDTTADKQKVAEIIRKIMGVDIKVTNPEAVVDAALRKSVSLDKNSLKIFDTMLKLADEVGINYNKKLIPSKLSKLTQEQTEIAISRAERYGRVYPNPIDTQWALREAKAPSIVIGKDEIGSAASLSSDDEMKLNVMNDPEAAKKLAGQVDTIDIKGSEHTHIGASLTRDGDDTLAKMKAKKVMNEEEEEEDDSDDVSEDDIDKMIDSLEHEDYLDAYDDDEFGIVDVETGEEEEEEKPVNEQAIMEVLSKIERMKARLRFAKNKPKIQRARMLALKRHSDSKKINKRARHMAVNMFRRKLAKGRDVSTMSTTERERIDRMVEKRKTAIGRMALKLTTKIRQLEKNRLSHKNYTKG